MQDVVQDEPCLRRGDAALVDGSGLPFQAHLLWGYLDVVAI